MEKLFEDDWGQDNSPQDNTQITTTLLYYSDDQLAEFKKLCRQGMRQHYGPQAKEYSISEYLLELLKQTSNDEQGDS